MQSVARVGVGGRQKTMRGILVVSWRRTDTGSVPTCGPAARVGLGLDFGVPFRYLISNSRDFLVRQTKIKTADSFLWESTVGVRGGS